MKIITGKTATEHVNSEDDRGLYAGIFGSGSYILNTGTKFQTSIESSTTIRINSGDLVHQGCHARIPYDEYDEVTIDAGTTGYKRIDLIVARYERNAGLESMSLVAIKGQPAVSDPVVPDYEHGNILEGANISDMPLYKVTLDGVNIESIERVYTELTSIENMLIQLNNNIDELTNALAAETEAREDGYSNLEGGIRTTNENLEDCRNVADGAQETAETAQETAETALNNAATAKSAADDAQETADSAINMMNNAKAQKGNVDTGITTISSANDLATLKEGVIFALSALSSALNSL